MKRTVSQSDLCAAHGAESLHGEHVARLALRLFDALAQRGFVAPVYRRVLEAAARLHDVGFGLDPVRHPFRSARIVRDAPIAGMTARQRALAAGAIVLHSGDWRRIARTQYVRQAPVRHAVLQMGAILRVADGLDRGHIQDARIRSIRDEARRLRVRIVSDGYWRNAERANAKADLWRAVFPVGVRFDSRRHRKVVHYRDVVARRDSSLAAARHILSLEYRLALDSVKNAIDGTDPEALHDLRVALRRFREGLRFFRRWLAPLAAESLRRRIGRFCRRVGRARDIQVGMALVEKTLTREGMRRSRTLTAMQRQEIRTAQRNLRRILRQQGFARLAEDMQRLVRAGIPRLESRGLAPRFRVLAARKVGKAYRRLIHDEKPSADWSPERLHELRKQSKRVRYWAEFASPVLGSGCVDLAERLKSVTSTLGDLHDLDVHLERPGKPRRLRRAMRRRRRSVRDKFFEAWDRLTEGAFRRSLDRSLGR